MAVEVKTISLADMASKTHWPPAEDVVTGIHAMKAIAQMQAQRFDETEAAKMNRAKLLAGLRERGVLNLDDLGRREGATLAYLASVLLCLGEVGGMVAGALVERSQGRLGGRESGAGIARKDCTRESR